MKLELAEKEGAEQVFALYAALLQQGAAQQEDGPPAAVDALAAVRTRAIDADLKSVAVVQPRCSR